MSETVNGSGRARRYFSRTLMVMGALTLLSVSIVLIALLFGRGERVPNRVVLELDLEQGLVEYVPDDPIAAALARDQLSIRDVVEALHQATTDDRVVALVARVGAGELGLAQVEEIRDAVAAFRASGKPTVLFSETFGEFASGQGGYYLATAFERVYLQPSGDVGLAGLISLNPFFSGTLEQLGVEVRMDNRYEYKNALNIFTESEMTEPHREAVEAVLRSSYENIVAGISAGRGLTLDEARRAVDNGPYYGEEAVRARLVDGLAYRDEVYDSIRVRVGGDPEFLFLRRYLKGAGRPFQRGEGIALIYGTGAVQRGSSDFSPLTGGSAMGSETVARAFRDAIEDAAIRAIIFRVDSPGGSYVASDVIWRETIRAKAAGKPVIVTMGNVAGSGGYFVAMAADRIVAQPSTITGSIGVVGGKMLLNELSGKLGVTWDDVQVGGNASMWSTFHDYSPAESQRMQALLDRIYQDFTAKVASGRGLSADSVHAIARGRIWSGVDAHRLGLVDELGGFQVALRLARETAGIAPNAAVRLRVFPAERTFLELLLDRGRRSSYPTGYEASARLIREIQPVVGIARRAGLLGSPGVLTMPSAGF
jgi:protease-4